MTHYHSCLRLDLVGCHVLAFDLVEKRLHLTHHLARDPRRYAKAHVGTFELDLFVALDESEELLKQVDFFSQVRGKPGARKGLLRVDL